jgi:hypothetical protein
VFAVVCNNLLAMSVGEGFAPTNGHGLKNLANMNY